METNLEYEVVLGIKKDCKVLQDKMKKALESDNIGTYNNLQKGLINSINAIKELGNEYKTMYSEYYLDEDKKQKQVAVWEQNSNGEVRNHKVWNIADDICDNITGKESDTHSISRYFNKDLKLTPIQKQLIELKNMDMKCLRGEGSTFGVILSAINQASMKDDTNVLILTPQSIGINGINEKIVEILSKYMANKKTEKIDSTYDGGRLIKIKFSNGSLIVICSANNENIYRYMHKPDLIYTSSSLNYYSTDSVVEILKNMDVSQDTLVTFTVLRDGDEYYDIKKREVVRNYFN